MSPPDGDCASGVENEAGADIRMDSQVPKSAIPGDADGLAPLSRIVLAARAGVQFVGVPSAGGDY